VKFLAAGMGRDVDHSVSEKVGMSKGRVHQIRRQLGIPAAGPTLRAIRRERVYQQLKVLAKQGVTLQEAERKLGVSRQSIRRITETRPVILARPRRKPIYTEEQILQAIRDNRTLADTAMQLDVMIHTLQRYIAYYKIQQKVEDILIEKGYTRRMGGTLQMPAKWRRR
jgi:hypothetical protein